MFIIMNRLWLTLEAAQQPVYASLQKLSEKLSVLAQLPALIKISELHNLKSKIASASKGDKLILNIGDCAEPFSDCKDSILSQKIKSYSDYSEKLKNISGKSVVLIGRIAGQYTKPRSEPYELVNQGIGHLEKIQIYRGDLVNTFDYSEREPDPNKLIEGYYKSATISNYIRLSGIELFTSHEALHINYENALTRAFNNKFINFGAHFLWLGQRTRKLGNAHVEYLSNIENPIGIKIGNNTNITELLAIIEKINPNNEEGKIVLIPRLGVSLYKSQLPKIIEPVKNSQKSVAWIIDPMHGNTYKTKSGFKTRNFADIFEETLGSIQILKEFEEIPAGVHLESSYDNVTEVIGLGVDEENLSSNYTSLCDPRLNYYQTLDLLSKISLALK